MDWEAVIGLEVHVQLNTQTKLFCACPVSFGAPPNTNTCPVCMGHPGTLPVLNEEALYKATSVGLALQARINQNSFFDRKSYFYPDLPKGYQISQQYKPICEGGTIAFQVRPDPKNNQTFYDKKVKLKRLHLEEDAGKLIHAEVPGLGESYVDLNRAGTPLVEIVCEPEIHTSFEAVAYLENLKRIMRYLNVSDCNMEEGSLRCDVNISLRPKGSKELGNRTEVKNLNSFRSVKEAIDHEVLRQQSILEEGNAVESHTLHWDASKMHTKSLRSKEAVQDYRYFPEPDLPACFLSDERIDDLKKNLVELPEDRRRRFTGQYNLSESDALVLVSDKALGNYFEDAVRACPSEPKKICNWITTEILSILNEKLMGIESFSVPPKHVGELIGLISEGKLSGKLAKELFPAMVETGKEPKKLMEERGLKVLSGEKELLAIAQDLVNKHPDIVEKYRAGNKNVFGFFVGQAMKVTKGQANPVLLTKILKGLIEGE